MINQKEQDSGAYILGPLKEEVSSLFAVLSGGE